MYWHNIPFHSFTVRLQQEFHIKVYNITFICIEQCWYNHILILHEIVDDVCTLSVKKISAHIFKPQNKNNGRTSMTVGHITWWLEFCQYNSIYEAYPYWLVLTMEQPPNNILKLQCGRYPLL